MDYKVLTYLLYLTVTVPLTIFVARTLYGNGKVYLQDVFDGDETLAEAVDHLLVVGFYRLNLDAAKIHSPVVAAERTTVVANPWGAPR